MGPLRELRDAEIAQGAAKSDFSEMSNLKCERRGGDRTWGVKTVHDRTKQEKTRQEKTRQDEARNTTH